jgi:hypothetical protein
VSLTEYGSMLRVLREKLLTEMLIAEHKASVNSVAECSGLHGAMSHKTKIHAE